MRFRVVALAGILATVICLAKADSGTTEQLVLNDLRIPVELVKGIKSEKVKPGDPVKLRMAEAILAGKGVVIPASARLYGHVLLSGQASAGNRAFLSIVVDRAEWKGHVLPLKAYVIGWGQRRFSLAQSADCQPWANFTQNRFAPGTMNSYTAEAFQSFDCIERPDFMDSVQVRVTSDINIIRFRKDRSTVLTSRKRIHLPSGTLMMLQNEGTAVSEEGR